MIHHFRHQLPKLASTLHANFWNLEKSTVKLSEDISK